MATLQVRDVPDEVAEVIAEKAKAAHKSVSGYLRDLMAADVRQELQRRAYLQWEAGLSQTQAELGLPRAQHVSSAEIIREIREEVDRGKS